MHESDFTKNYSVDELNLPTEKPERPGRSTGPTSPEGKAKSSMNRLTHGCRSEQIIINGEDPAEFEFVIDRWFNAYQPQDSASQTLVEELGKAQWMLQRNEKWLHQIQQRLPVDAWTWTDEHHKLLANGTRYKTTAERSFYRAFNNLEAYYKRKSDKAATIEKARAQMAKIHIQWLKNKAAAAARELRLVQMVEVTANTRGECVTTSAPTNEQLIALASNAAEAPEFVSRFVFFTAGVPPAYEWVNPNHIQANEPAIGIQQFTWSGWLQQIEAERVAGSGHIEPYLSALLPDPD